MQLVRAHEVVVPTAYHFDARQIGGLREVRIEMVEEFANSPPGVGERGDVFFAESCFREKVFGSVDEPSEGVPLSYDTVGKLDGGFALGSNLRQVGDCNGVEFLVN